LVHPKYLEDVVGLSKAVDTLVRGLWPMIDLSVVAVPLREAAWFNYVPAQQRPAAAQYRELIAPLKPRWRSFKSAIDETCDGTIDTEEHVLRTVLLSNVEVAGGSAETVKSSFPAPGSLLSHVSEREEHETHIGREGESRQTDVRLAVLQEIADEIIRKPRLF
jgi:hypothetical protein